MEEIITKPWMGMIMILMGVYAVFAIVWGRAKDRRK